MSAARLFVVVLVVMTSTGAIAGAAAADEPWPTFVQSGIIESSSS